MYCLSNVTHTVARQINVMSCWPASNTHMFMVQDEWAAMLDRLFFRLPAHNCRTALGHARREVHLRSSLNDDRATGARRSSRMPQHPQRMEDSSNSVEAPTERHAHPAAPSSGTATQAVRVDVSFHFRSGGFKEANVSHICSQLLQPQVPFSSFGFCLPCPFSDMCFQIGLWWRSHRLDAHRE
ncbi:hypothetical protein GQ44DRAFT_92253 [Phaeosphaeriaceae sp. PMI808]|nr:hypothetical protein GQ44DRAFT_92253 [Phaeosphaeriaceae sp. PMI808]